MAANNALNIISSGIVTYNGAGSFTALANPLTLANGGTGSSTLTTPNGVLISNGSALTQLTTGNNNSILSGRTGLAPIFSTTSTTYFTGVSFDSGSHTLNSYTFGTFNGTMVGGSTAGTTTYADQNSYYTRVGNVCTAWLYVLVNTITGTGQATFGGLPFTIKNQTSYNGIASTVVNGAALTASYTFTWAQGVLNTTTAIIFQQNPTTGSAAAFAIAAPAQTAYYLTITFQI